MANSDYIPTPKQIRAYKALSRIAMEWIAFFFIIFVFAAMLALFVWALVTGQAGMPTTIVGVLDVVFGVSLNRVYGHLFPGSPNS